MGMNAFGGEGYKPVKAPGAEQAPDPAVDQLASVAEVLEERTAQIEAAPAMTEDRIPGELSPEQEQILHETINEVRDKE